MNAIELFRAGKLTEAIEAAGAELRPNPTDSKLRTFLFELLCFAGDYDRAEKQLNILAQGGPQVELGVLLYRGALFAERARQELFHGKDLPSNSEDSAAGPFSGTLNGRRFQSLSDADSRIGARLEVLAAGKYLWLPLQHVVSIEIAAPRRLRDLLWIPAVVRVGPEFKGRELGEVLLPALSPLSWLHPDDTVRLGRQTVWVEQEGGNVVPFGQKLLLVDGEEFPILEIRNIAMSGAERES
jgi:type VI secretion system protein ImpE